jgi:hypothetical protein
LSRRGLAAAAVGAASLLSFAPRAGAQAVPPPTVTVTITTPKASSPPPVFGAPPTTSGSVHASGFNGATVLWVEAKLVWGKTGGPPMPKPVSICGPAPDAPPPPAPPPCPGGPDVTFTNALTPAPAYNGPYQLVVIAHAQDGINQQNDGAKDVTYSIAAKPANVGTLKASVKNRVVTVGWDRNTEPDMQRYDVYRQGPGEKPPTSALVQVEQPPSGTRVAFDDDTAPAAGGDYIYTLFAVRTGATGDAKTSVVASNPVSVKATLPPGTPPASPPVTQPGPSGTPTGPPVIKSTMGSIPKLSSASPATTPTTSLATPDPGFVRGLPYAGTNTTLPSGGEGGDASVALTPSGGRHKSNTKGLLVPAAGGAILFVAAFQLRWLKKRLDEPVLPIN